MDALIAFREKLSELMLDAGNVKSAQLGDALNISGQTVRAWRDGTQSIFLSNAIRLADFFKCSLDFLFGRSDELIDFTPQACPPFYDNLRKIMQEKGATRYRITKETKIKDSYFTTWKNGSEPHILSVITLADYLDVTLDYLVGRER